MLAPRIERERALEAAPCVRGAPVHEIEDAERQVHVDVGLGDREGAVEGRPRLRSPAEALQREAFHQVHVGVARVTLHRGSDGFQRQARVSGGQQGASQADATVRVQRIDPHRLAKGGECLLGSPRAPIGLAEEEPALGAHRIEIAATLEGLHRGGAVAGTQISLGERGAGIFGRGRALDELLPRGGLLGRLPQVKVDAREAIRVHLLRRETIDERAGRRQGRVPPPGGKLIAAGQNPALYVGLATAGRRGAWQQRPGEEPHQGQGDDEPGPRRHHDLASC